MFLLIDVGNTNITFAIFKESKIIFKWNLGTHKYRKVRELKKYIKNILSQKGFYLSSLKGVIICSVVPKSTLLLKKTLRTILGFDPLIVGEDIFVPIKNLYKRPQSVGQDRLVNSFAGTVLYGAPLIIIDFGTAITFDLVSRDKEYLGGLILPGIRISLEALSEKTSLLPCIKRLWVKELLGRTTRESICSGIVYGFSSCVEGIIKKLKAIYFKEALVVATGGDLFYLKDFIKGIDILDSELILKGLIFLINQNKTKIFKNKQK